MKEIIITNKDDGVEITLPSMPYGESITIINESNKPVIIMGSTTHAIQECQKCGQNE